MKIEELLKFDPKAKTKTFQKNDIVQRAHDPSPSAIFVEKGLLRSYIIDSKGKEHIYMFAPEGWFIADLEAMEYDQPVQLFIDCLEDSTLTFFDNDCLFKANLSKQEIMQNAQLLYRRIGRLQRRVLMLMGAPAIDRYHYFIKTYPDLHHRIPQRMIASFLGVTPQTLSTLRGKIARSS
ncbi:MAG: Crp/Fnr family transcriptional regulator [Bacteroidota bacterium]